MTDRDYNWNMLYVHASPGYEEPSKIFLRTEWLEEEKEIDIRLTFQKDENDVWVGRVSYDDLHRRAKDFEIPIEDYTKEVRESLTTTGGLKDFDYLCNLTDPSTLRFDCVKKQTGVKLVFLSGTLKRADRGDRTLNLFQEFALLKENERKLRGDLETMKNCYKQAMDSIKEGETIILSKCRLLINSKKARIRELEDKLKKAEEQNQKTLVAASATTTDSEDTPLANLQMRKRARSLNRIFSQSSQDSEPLLVSTSLPKRSRVEEPEEAFVGSCIADMKDGPSPVTVLDSQTCDDALFDQL